MKVKRQVGLKITSKRPNKCASTHFLVHFPHLLSMAKTWQSWMTSNTSAYTLSQRTTSNLYARHAWTAFQQLKSILRLPKTNIAFKTRLFIAAFIYMLIYQFSIRELKFTGHCLDIKDCQSTLKPIYFIRIENKENKQTECI